MSRHADSLTASLQTLVHVISFLSVLLLFTTPVLAQNQHQEAGFKVRVTVVGEEPYVKDDDSGLSQRVWNEVARRANLSPVTVPTMSLEQAMNELRSGKLDLVVGALPPDPQLARDGLLSLSYGEITLGLASTERHLAPWELLTPLLDPRLLVLFLGLIGVALAFGAILWWFERGHDEKYFPISPGKGILRGLWFALITVSTVGYGNVAIKTSPGRIVASLLLLGTFAIQAVLTAVLASTLTNANMGLGPPASLSGLQARTLAVVGGSEADRIVSKTGAKVKRYSNLSNALEAHADGKVYAVAGPYLELKLLTNRLQDQNLEVNDLQLPLRSLHFAMSAPLQKRIGYLLLRIKQERLVQEESRRIIGESGGGN